MKDLTTYETEAVSKEVAEFVENMRFLSLDCIIIIAGRGMTKVGFDTSTVDIAPTMLAAAYSAAVKRKSQQPNKSLN